MRKYTKFRMDSDKLTKAIDRAVNECIKEGVLAEFLSAHKSEVKGMILTEYDEQKTMEMLKKEFRQDGWNDGYSEGERIGYSKGEQRGYSSGMDDGRMEEKYMTAVRMKSMGVPEEQLAKFLDVTPEKLKEMLSSDKVHEENKEYAVEEK